MFRLKYASYVKGTGNEVWGIIFGASGVGSASIMAKILVALPLI